MRAGYAVALGFLLVLTSTPSRADDKEACIAASEGADRLDDAGKLIELRERLAFCGRDVCPTVVRQECVRRLEALEKRIPTIIVRATDDHGADIVDARVLVDDKVVAEQIDGKPIKLDPGPHVVHVRPANGGSKVQKVVAAEGDHLRAVTLSFAPDGAATPAPPKDDGTTEETVPGSPVRRWVGVGLMVVGVGALSYGVYALFAAVGNSSSFRNEGVGIPTCSAANGPPCHVVDSSGLTYADRANSFYIQMGVAGLVGITAATVGTILLLTSFESKRAVKRETRLTPALGAGYAGLSLGGSF
jgi:hypothetical protein